MGNTNCQRPGITAIDSKRHILHNSTDISTRNHGRVNKRLWEHVHEWPIILLSSKFHSSSKPALSFNRMGGLSGVAVDGWSELHIAHGSDNMQHFWIVRFVDCRLRGRSWIRHSSKLVGSDLLELLLWFGLSEQSSNLLRLGLRAHIGLLHTEWLHDFELDLFRVLSMRGNLGFHRGHFSRSGQHHTKSEDWINPQPIFDQHYSHSLT